MKYSANFVKKVRLAFPNSKKIQEAAEQGSEFVGRYLDDNRDLSMSPEEIVTAYKQGREKDVLKAAKEAAERTKLYHEWKKCR